MNSYIVLCGVLCAVFGQSYAGIRFKRQMWSVPDDHHHFHFPEMDNNERFNEVIDFPDNRPDNGFGQRPDNGLNWGSNGQNWGVNNQNNWPGSNQNWNNNNNQNWNNNNNQNWNGNDNQNWGRPNDNQPRRPQRPNASTARPSTTTTQSSSTPRTFHLAPEGCDCPSTPQFNPVCGSDGNTYKNSGLLNCFRVCGVDVSQRRMGAC